MSRISPEKEISYISKVIEKNIFYYDSCLKDKGFLSENILSQLRNLVEDVAILLNNKLNNLNLDTHYDNIHGSFDAIKGKKYKEGSVAFLMTVSGVVYHAIFIGKTTKDNIFYWAHTSNRDGYNTNTSYGIKEIIDSGIKVAIISVNYNVNMRF